MRPRTTGIIVDRVRQIVDELDDHFCQPVGWRRFSCEKERARHHIQVWILTQPVVNDDDPQRIQQLPLVFVNALDLAVEDRIGIHDLARRRLEPVGEAHLGFALCGQERLPKARNLAANGLRSRELVQVGDPAFADRSRDHSSQPGFDWSSQRRGVTPLVLLLKRSGNISASSFTVVVRNSFEWTAATPLVLCEPTMARLAMRILRALPSSTG